MKTEAMWACVLVFGGNSGRRLLCRMAPGQHAAAE